MKTIVGLIFLLFPLFSLAQSVTYRVTFTGTWTSNDSSPYPMSAHFSPLIGATHIPNAAIWKRGEVASLGVQEVAELGATLEIMQELTAAENAGTTGPIVVLDDLFNLPNASTTVVEFTEQKSHITLISMVAPSPDWFVGVSDLSLRNNGQWIENLTVDLHPYDAGTEEGDTFSLFNSATVPRQAIALIGSSPFFQSSPIIGRIKFKLLTQIQPPVTSPPVENKKNPLSPIHGLLLD